ncbi:acyl-CoA dehydrogenase family protein [Jhaorihella thermophila]
MWRWTGEASVAVGFLVARAFDGTDDGARALARIGVALAKFLNNKRCVPVVAEAMEVLGGMGYVEETPMPMFFRQSPLNGIWGRLGERDLPGHPALADTRTPRRRGAADGLRSGARHGCPARRRRGRPS